MVFCESTLQDYRMEALSFSCVIYVVDEGLKALLYTTYQYQPHTNSHSQEMIHPIVPISGF